MPSRLPRLLHGRWLVVLIVGVMLLLLACSVVNPPRSVLWNAVGLSCGQFAVTWGKPSPPHALTPEESCFKRDFDRCQAASITMTEQGVDTARINTFVVEPALVGIIPCELTDMATSISALSSWRITRTYTCAGLTQEPDGLHIHACGQLGDITLPAESL